MLIAKDKTFKRFLAPELEKSEVKYFCPECDNVVIFKKGKIKIAHFSHKVKANCSNYESLDHYEAKYMLYKKFKRSLYQTEIESLRFKNFRPDIYVPEFKIALEIQRSKLSKEVFWIRTEKYINNNIRVFWIFLDKSMKYEGACIKMSKMMREAFRLYKNHIYIYDPNWEYIEKLELGNVYSESEYYDEYGNLQYSSRLLLTFKKIIKRTKLYEKYLK